MQNNNPWVRRSISIGIVILLNLFFNYLVSLVFVAPQFKSYFAKPQVVDTFTTKESCLSVGGQWSESSYTDPKGVKTAGSCDPDYTKRTEYEAATKSYDKKVFISLILLGLLSIIAGVFIGNSLLKVSFVWGGVLSFFIASVRYWSDAAALLKVFVLGLALAGLIVLVIKKFGGSEEKTSQ